MKQTPYYSSIEEVLTSILDIMKHIKNVQKEIITLSKESSNALLSYIKEKGEPINKEVLMGMQLQDIISQQLGAVVEAIEMVENNVSMHIRATQEDNAILRNSLSKLHKKLISSLDEAKTKQQALIGHTNIAEEDRNDELEFF